MCGFGRSHRVTWRGERARACELGGWENRGLRGGGRETLRGRDVGEGRPSAEGTWGGGSSAVRADPGPGSVSHQRCLDFVVPDKAGAS